MDIEERFCELVRRRAELLRIDNVTIINSDFLWVETAEKTFDAIVFFESFHHCWEFRRLLRALHRVLKPGGKIYFAAEPISPDFGVPWGVRLDGESPWVARRAGWMELGFHSDFFEELLSRTGWIGQCVHPNYWVATSRTDAIVISASDPRVHSQAGTKEGGLLHVRAPGGAADRKYALHGPYLGLPKGQYWAEVKLAKADMGLEGAIVDVCRDGGRVILNSRTCTADELRNGRIRIDFSLSQRANDLEVRLLVAGRFSATIIQLSLRAWE